MPFASPDERAIHFARHGHEFGAANEVEYEQMADGFMSQPLTIGMRECTRPNGRDRIRIFLVNAHFGVAVVASTVVRTFYVVPTHQIIRRGGTTLSFFTYECARTDI